MELNIKFDEKMLVATANRVLDEYEYNGKTIREWADIISNPRTNADRIRRMTDEELAEFCMRYMDCTDKCVAKSERCCMSDITCQKAWLAWLKEEVKAE